MERISIVVPVYNEGATIGAVLERLLTIDLPAPREIIVINDGSNDGTHAALERFAAERPSVIVIHEKVNRGKGHAVRLGFARATGTIVAIQDADLELDPAQLADLVAPILNRETEVLYGSRFLRGTPSGPVLTVAANRFLTWLTNRLFESALTDMETCYKIMRIEVARSLNLTANRFDIEPEITAKLLMARHKIVERPVRFAARSRAAGKKIRWQDGVEAIGVLLKHRIAGRRVHRRSG